MASEIVPATTYKIMEEQKKNWMPWSCRMHVTWDTCIWLAEILNHNEKSTPLLGAYTCTKLQTRWLIQCCCGWLNSFSQTLLHIHCKNNANISAVVMLGFWLCQFKLCFSLSAVFFLLLLKLNICSLLLVRFEIWVLLGVVCANLRSVC